MKQNSPKTASFLVMLILFLAFSPALLCGAFQQAGGEDEALKKNQERIVAAPKDIKEGVAVYVFLAWMWLSILVLVYFLREKIKESDRVHRLSISGLPPGIPPR
jgi:ABC-type Fe3+ transport system permease subunit